MKGHIPGETIEEIKNRVNIADLVSEYVTLRKAGRNFIGLCPFHKEKTPSFTVNPDKQMFYCFGCGEGGHAFTFLMKVNNMTFPEAVRHLAAKAGVVIPERAMDPGEREKVSLREQIHHLNNVAATHFSRNLFSQAGKVGREYLKNRGIKEEVVREFRLGYALDGWRFLRDYLERGKLSLKLAEQAGLLAAKTGENNFYDRFRGRLIFPIEDLSGKVIAFGGRIIGPGEPKYLNSPESPVYVKGRNLYGLNKTRESIRKSGYAVLVEGYFDLLSLWNAGIANVVATLGTALTREQVDLIRRYTGRVVALFDPDEAGKKALARSLEMFVAGNIDAQALVLPTGYDPDEYVRTFGREKMEGLITGAPSLVDYYIENIIGARGTLVHDRRAVSEAVAFIVCIEDNNSRELFIKRVSEKLGVRQELLLEEVQRVRKATPAKSAVRTKEEAATVLEAGELKLIHILMEYPDRIPRVRDAAILQYFTDGPLKAFGEVLITDAGGSPDTSGLLDRLENDAVRGRLHQLMVGEKAFDERNVDKLLADTMGHIMRKWYEKRRGELNVEIARAQKMGEDELSIRLLGEFQRLKEQERLKTPTFGKH